MCVENESAPKGRKKRSLVPSKGLEPPHPCEYMDLNHARLPIPPRWQVNLHSSGDLFGRRVRKTYTSILQSARELSNICQRAASHRKACTPNASTSTTAYPHATIVQKERLRLLSVAAARSEK